jgi:hypothetical protein
MNKEQRIADLKDVRTAKNPDAVLVAKINDLRDEIQKIEDKTVEKTEVVLADLDKTYDQLAEDIKKISKDKDYSDDYFKKELQTLKNVIADVRAKKVDRIIEKTEVIKEVPTPIDTDKIAQEASEIALVATNKLIQSIPPITDDLPKYGGIYRDALETLKDEDRLSASAIKDLPEFVEKTHQTAAFGVREAPRDGKQYARKDRSWVEVTNGASTYASLTDVNMTGLVDGNMPIWDATSSKWIPGTPTDTDEKVKLNASDPTAGYLDDKITGYGFLDDASAFATSAQGLLADTALQAETDPLSLHLDQTTPQTITGGKPNFSAGFKAITQIGSTLDNGLEFYNYDSSQSVNGALISMGRARGTIASPEIVQVNDYISRIKAFAYDGTGLKNSGELRFYIDGTPGASDVPTGFQILLAPDGSATRQEVFDLSSAGILSLAKYTDTGLLNISGGVVGVDTSTYVTGTPWTSEGYLTDISGQDLSTADNSTSQFITLADVPAPDLSAYAKLDGTNQPFTGNLNISKATPTLTLTSTDESNHYAELSRSATNRSVTLKNEVGTPGADPYSLSTNGTSYVAKTIAGLVSQDLTISMWVNPSSAVGVLMSWGFSFTGAELGFILALGQNNGGNAGAISWCNGDGGANSNKINITSNGVITTGSWQHIFAVKSGNNITIYVNNSQVYSGTTNRTAIASTNNSLRLGKNSGEGTYWTTGYNGLMDEVVLFNRAITSGERDAIYASGVGLYSNPANAPFNSGLVEGWHADEGTGNTLAGISGTHTLTGVSTPTFGAGLVQIPASTQLGTILQYQDGILAGEKGIAYIGDASSRTVIQGLTTRFNVAGVEKGQLGSTMAWTLPNTITGSTDAIQLKVKGNSTQTSNPFQIVTSADANILSVSNAGVITPIDGGNFVLGATTGTKFGTATTQKLAFYNSTPIVQPANTVAIDTLLVNTGLRATGGLGKFDTTITPRAGTATAGTAPLKFTSGTSLTAPEAGAIEFTTDDYFATITTGTARKAFVLDDGARLTSGKIPVATTNGRLINLTAQTELTDELTSITHTAPGTPDYALQDLTDSSAGATFGFATKDEGNTVLSVILNLQTRVNELETKLTALGLLVDAD